MVWCIIFAIVFFFLIFLLETPRWRAKDLLTQIQKISMNFPSKSYMLYYEEYEEGGEKWIHMDCSHRKVYFFPVSIGNWTQLLKLLSKDSSISLDYSYGNSPPLQVEITKKEPA